MHSYQIVSQGQDLKKASKAIILLHGRGSTAFEIINLAKEFCDPNYYIAAPQATGNSWYPYSFLKEESLNEPWLSSAVDVVKKLIDEIERYIPKSHIYLMGFSQGACLTLEVASRFASKYGGVVAFTGGLIGNVIDRKKYNGNFEGSRVFIANSDRDPHVPLSRSEESKEIMEKLGANVQLKIYKEMAHTITETEIEDAKKWIFRP